MTVRLSALFVVMALLLAGSLRWGGLEAAAPARGSEDLSVPAYAAEAAELRQERRVELEVAREKERAYLLESAYYGDRMQAAAALGSEWAVFPSTSARGDVVLVRHDRSGRVEWLGRSYELSSFGEGYYAYIPIGMSAKPGTYKLGGAALTIAAKTFETQRLTVTEEQNAVRQDTARIAADQKLIDRARSQSVPTFLFPADSPFLVPVDGELTTPYGFTRYVNGEYAGSHNAIDLAAPEGTPVYATNDGIVALAANLHLTGNSIYIDHGLYLFSQYAHLSELRVKTGDKVKRGQLIGLVGTTGFSTGPHLHFTFWAHNVQVNPNVFFGTLPQRWTAEEEDKAS